MCRNEVSQFKGQGETAKTNVRHKADAGMSCLLGVVQNNSTMEKLIFMKQI